MEVSEFGTLTPEVATAISNSTEPRVVGRGIYLELLNTRNGYATQMLITPAGIDDKGNKVPACVIYRSVSTYSPRSQWRHQIARLDDKKSPTEKLSDLALFFDKQVGRMISYDYNTLRNNTPIVFEITNLDLAEIAEWKAPASAIRRIMKARTTLGFPNVVWEKSK